jgi:hypothetical protein
MSTAVADTCFHVHWLRFRERERIFEVFESIAVPVMVLDEMGARGRVMLAPWLASRHAFLIPRINERALLKNICPFCVSNICVLEKHIPLPKHPCSPIALL